MKKFIGLLVLGLLAQPTFAEWGANCTNNGGTIITANRYGNDKGGLCNNPSDPGVSQNCNGKSFCVGGQKVNWWSAFTWCESIGGKLASYQDLCPTTQTASLDTTIICDNIKGTSKNSELWGWTSLAKGDSFAFHVNFSSGKVSDGIGVAAYGRTNPNVYAVCSE